MWKINGFVLIALLALISLPSFANSSSSLDGKDQVLNQVYQRIIKKLPPDAANIIYQDELAWINFRSKVCKEKAIEVQEQCLAELAVQRTEELNLSGIKKGGFLFIQRGRWNWQENATHISWERASYPMIAYPLTSLTKEWNKQQIPPPVKAKDYCESEGEELNQEYKLGMVRSQLISILYSQFFQCEGARNSYGQTTARTFFIGKELKVAKPQDIFVRDGWQEILQSFAISGLKEKNITLEQKDIEQVKFLITNSEHWLLEEKGLRIFSGPREIWFGFAVDFDNLVPWNLIKPYLNPDLISRIKVKFQKTEIER